MTKKLEQVAKSMKGIRSVRVAGPEERIFGGKGILVRFKPNLTDDSPEKAGTPGDESSPTSPPATDKAGDIGDEANPPEQEPQ